MGKILIIFNPLAGRKYPLNFKEKFLLDCQKHAPLVIFDWLETLPNVLTHLPRYDLTKYDRLIIIGGDGTIKDVANYLLKNNLNVPLGIIPAGSANVLASGLNLPRNYCDALNVALLGKPRAIDVCRLNNEEYFLTCLSVGFWTKVIDKTKIIHKAHWGFFAYLAKLLKYWRLPKYDFNFTVDGQNRHLSGHTLVIANTLSVLKIQPRQKIDFADGRLEILINQNKTILGFLILIPAFFFGRNRFPLLYKTQGKKISVDLTKLADRVIQIDGEIRMIDKIEVEIIPNKFRIIT